MRYQQPFTHAQRLRGASVYRSMRNNLRRLTSDFPPANAQERSLLRDFRAAVRDFGEALNRELGKVDVDRLNDLQSRADWLALEYVATHIASR